MNDKNINLDELLKKREFKEHSKNFAEKIIFKAFSEQSFSEKINQFPLNILYGKELNIEIDLNTLIEDMLSIKKIISLACVVLVGFFGGYFDIKNSVQTLKKEISFSEYLYGGENQL